MRCNFINLWMKLSTIWMKLSLVLISLYFHMPLIFYLISQSLQCPTTASISFNFLSPKSIKPSTLFSASLCFSLAPISFELIFKRDLYSKNKKKIQSPPPIHKYTQELPQSAPDRKIVQEIAKDGIYRISTGTRIFFGSKGKMYKLRNVFIIRSRFSGYACGSLQSNVKDKCWNRRNEFIFEEFIFAQSKSRKEDKLCQMVTGGDFLRRREKIIGIYWPGKMLQN